VPPKLSEKTLQHIATLFPVEQREEVAALLEKECGNNLPFCEGRDELVMERPRFAVLKLSEGKMDKLRNAIKIAQRDWRDVLVYAGFGNDTKAHQRWNPTSSRHDTEAGSPKTET
jgi:hypothetical protein